MSNPVEIVALGNGAFRIHRQGGMHALAWGVAEGARTWIFVDGHTYIVEPPRGRRGAAADDATALAAPMPATVMQVHVEPGGRVTKGEVLVTLEAMKMELPITAPRDGQVKSIACKPGELVQPGIALVELEPEHEPRSENPEA